MSSPTVPSVEPVFWTIKDVIDFADGIPPERIRANPAPGTATEKDLLEVTDRTGRIFELVDGVLVEKVMGAFESRLAAVIIHLIEDYLEQNDVGYPYAPDALLRILPAKVRSPDVAFVRWERLPDREVPEHAITELVPDLAIEILSESNTEPEMQRKLKEYFRAGVGLVWYIDAKSRTARVFTSLRKSAAIPADGELDGGSVLPGFKLRLEELFRRAKRGHGKRG